MSEKKRWPLITAQALADELCSALSPACERIAIAGSVRRQRPDPADIELLCVPKTGDTVFGGEALDRLILDMMFAGVLDYRLNRRGSRQYGPENKFLVHVPSGIGVDVFSVPPEQWGMGLVIRTGPAEMNIKMMSRFLEMGYRGRVYGVRNRQGEELECPTEEGVFALLGWPWKEAWER